jgi:signal transduction histidine kinase
MGDEPGPRVEIGARPAAAADGPPAERPADPHATGGGMVLCRVADNGIGIDPRHRKRVFGLFERLDASTKGTGIGLALVKRIVEFHGGHVWIGSPGVAGKGTTFFFTLPAAAGANDGSRSRR